MTLYYVRRIRMAVRVRGNTNIEIIQGDSYTKLVKIKSGDFEITPVPKIVFTCEDLNIEKELMQTDDKRYVLYFAAEETALWKVYRGTCDFTVFIGEEVLTVLHDVSFRVLKKKNKVVL